MHKFLKMLTLTLLVTVFLQQIAFASGDTKKPPKPTEGTEASEPNLGTSIDVRAEYDQNSSDLFYDYYCSITNTGTDLYLQGATKSKYLSDQVKLTLYLQEWDGSQWVDLKSWVFGKFDAQSITEGAREDYEHEKYYRARAKHFIEYGDQSETQNSTSSYIYIE
jgi:hypothetical protein